MSGGSYRTVWRSPRRWSPTRRRSAAGQLGGQSSRRTASWSGDKPKPESVNSFEYCDLNSEDAWENPRTTQRTFSEICLVRLNLTKVDLRKIVQQFREIEQIKDILNDIEILFGRVRKCFWQRSVLISYKSMSWDPDGDTTPTHSPPQCWCNFSWALTGRIELSSFGTHYLPNVEYPMWQLNLDEFQRIPSWNNGYFIQPHESSWI